MSAYHLSAPFVLKSTIFWFTATWFLGCSPRLEPFKQGKYYGYENKKGDTVIEATYLQAEPFKDGWAKVGIATEVTDSLWIEPMFNDPGYWNVQSYTEKRFSYVNKKDSLLPYKFKKARNFENGYAAVQQGEIWGFLNSQGRWQIQPQYAHAEPFNKRGQAMVAKAEGSVWHEYLINTDNEIVEKLGSRPKPTWFDSIAHWETLVSSGKLYTRLNDYESALGYYNAAGRRLDTIARTDTLKYMQVVTELAYLYVMRVNEEKWQYWDSVATSKFDEVRVSDMKKHRKRLAMLMFIDYLIKVENIRELNLQPDMQISTLERILRAVKDSKTEKVENYWDIEEKLEELKKASDDQKD